MKTRVVAYFDAHWGREYYRVDRYSDFDFMAEGTGQKLCITLSGMMWREANRFEDAGAATSYAKTLANLPDDYPLDRVIAQFGEL